MNDVVNSFCCSQGIAQEILHVRKYFLTMQIMAPGISLGFISELQQFSYSFAKFAMNKCSLKPPYEEIFLQISLLKLEVLTKGNVYESRPMCVESVEEMYFLKAFLFFFPHILKTTLL